MMPNKTMPTMNSLGWSGSSGPNGPVPSRRIIEGSLQDEGDCETEDGQSLDHGEADPGSGHEGASRLGLTGGAVDDCGPDHCDADARADGRDTVADHVQRAGDFQEGHDGSFRIGRFSIW